MLTVGKSEKCGKSDEKKRVFNGSFRGCLLDDLWNRCE